MSNEKKSGGWMQQQSPQLGRFLQGAAAGLSNVTTQAAQSLSNGAAQVGSMLNTQAAKVPNLLLDSASSLTIKTIKASFKAANTVLSVFAGAALAGGVHTTVVTPDMGNQPPEAIGRAVIKNAVVFAKDKEIPFIAGAAQEAREQVGVGLKSLDEFMRSRQGR